MSLNEPINVLLMEGPVEDSGSRKLRATLGYGGVGTVPHEGAYGGLCDEAEQLEYKIEDDRLCVILKHGHVLA